MENILLAIIIPAYKAQFLEMALSSLSHQTNKDFRVYIGDDHSPYDLLSVARKFENEYPIIYRRFDKNQGSVSLVKQWTRSIGLSADEPYIWLFGDDDVAEPNCVEMFYKCIKEDPRAGLFRFSIKTINASGSVINNGSEIPASESAIEFISQRMNFQIQSSLSQYIFHRSLFRKSGFPDFPHGWCADDAMVVEYSSPGKIRGIPGAAVHWRISSENISGDNRLKEDKLAACSLYKDWLTRRFPDMDSLRKREIRYWFFRSHLILKLNPFSLRRYNRIVKDYFQSLHFRGLLFLVSDSFRVFTLMLRKS